LVIKTPFYVQPIGENTDTAKSRSPQLSVPFFPKAAIITWQHTLQSAQAGLLTRFTFCGLPILQRLVAGGKQWQYRMQKVVLMKHTASGNVPDSHRVPF
jgi:hypothetical protein